MHNSIKKPETENFKFFCNKECEYFPCHEIPNPEDFNCMFCFCPLYALGRDCGGNFVYTEEGIKDCSDCIIPHNKGAYDYIIEKSKALIELVKEK
ncbi:MAG: cysteine-rich small domain-containing protein [Eubacteriales bacterium]|nr:cysteine-rich small domain-containing protein [Eubacteriales bacterium]